MRVYLPAKTLLKVHTVWAFIKVISLPDFPKNLSGASFHTCWFCTLPPSFEAVSCFICSRRRVAVTRHRYRYLVFGHEESYFVKEHSDSKHKYSEDDIIKMLEFLVDNIFVVFAGKVFQQIVGIPMGTNCAPLLADIFLYSYEAEFIQSLL